MKSMFIFKNGATDDNILACAAHIFVTFDV